MVEQKAMRRCSRCRKTKDIEYFTRLSLISNRINEFKSCNSCARYRFIYRNKKTSKENRSNKIKCECGSMITKAHISSHKKTKRHLKKMM